MAGNIFKGETAGLKPHNILEKGIARTFQNIRLFPNMTCLENVMAGQHARSDSGMWQSIFKTPYHRKEEQKLKNCRTKVGTSRIGRLQI